MTAGHESVSCRWLPDVESFQRLVHVPALGYVFCMMFMSTFFPLI